MSENQVVQNTLAQMADENSDETQGWDAGKEFADAVKAAVVEELRELRRLNYSETYIDAWKSSAESIFYQLTLENK